MPQVLAQTAQKVTFEATLLALKSIILHLNKCSKDALKDVDSARNMFTNYAEQLSTYTIISGFTHQAHRLISDSVPGQPRNPLF